MSQDEAARSKWWEGLSALERINWDAKARRAGVTAWDLMKASIFDRGVTLAELRGQRPQDAGVAEAQKSQQ